MTQQVDESRAAETPAAPRAVERAFPVGAARLALEAAIVGGVALLYILLVYRVFDARFSVPLHEDGADGRSTAAWVKAIHENGWWLHNPHLGAPFGQNNHDFPLSGETLQVVALKALGFVLPSYGEVMNVYYLASYPLTAIVALLVLRHLRFSVWVSLPIALAYALLPFHFFHQQEHLTRTMYVTAPLAILLLLRTLSWREFFLVDPRPPAGTRLRDNLRRERVGLTVAMTVFIGAFETMTTIFTATLLVAVAIVAAVRWRAPSRLLVGFGFAAVLAVTFLALGLPSFKYWHTEGHNPVAGQRIVSESEYYGLKLSNLVLPDPTHRFEPFRQPAIKLQAQTPVRSEGGQALGTLATLGFFGAIIALFAFGLRRRRRTARWRAGPRARAVLVGDLGLIIALAVLCAVIAGFSNLIAVAGFDQVRTWNRIVVMIGFASLVVTAAGIEWILARVAGRWGRATLAGAVACVVLSAFAMWDAPPPVPRDYPAMNASWDSDEAFVKAIDGTLPGGSNIFQWPVYPYPETRPPGSIRDYDHLRGYLHDHAGMNWSYGAVKGRPRADWQNTASTMGPVAALPGLLGLGFSGYWIDTLGYDPGQLEVLRSQLRRKLGVEPVTSPDQRFLFYDLRPYKQRLGQPDAALRRQAFTMFGV